MSLSIPNIISLSPSLSLMPAACTMKVPELLVGVTGISGSGISGIGVGCLTVTMFGIGRPGVGLNCLNGLNPLGIVGSLDGINCAIVLPEKFASLSVTFDCSWKLLEGFPGHMQFVAVHAPFLVNLSKSLSSVSVNRASWYPMYS